MEDDAIEACVNLIKDHLQKHLMPALSNTGHLGMSLAVALKEEVDEEPMPRAKRVKTSPQRGAVAKGLKAVYSPLLSTVGTFGTILERAKAFIVANEMDDRLLFTLSAAAFLSLAINASPAVRADVGSLASIVQMSAMDLIAAMFGRYPRHRSIIVEDLFPLMLKLPTLKRSLRAYPVGRGGGVVKRERPQSHDGDHDYIQPVCALILVLVQSSVVMPYQSDKDAPLEEGDADAYSKDDNEDDEEEDNEEKLARKANDTLGLDGCIAVCNQFTL